jgi:hypothetical protein
MKRIALIGAAAACMFAACKPNVSVTTPPTAGQAVFKNYLAIGSSFTAGVTDGSLFVTAQHNSFPQRLFEQFSTITDNNGAVGPFIQPYLVGDNGYPNPKLVLTTVHTFCGTDTMLGAVPYPNFVVNPADAQPFISSSNNGQINNIAVPLQRVIDYKYQGYALQNPWAMRSFLNTINVATWRPIDELSYRVRNQHPTFFTFWMGVDDVMGYAVAGGQGDGSANALPVNPAAGIYNTNDISNYDSFVAYYDTALKTVISTSSMGALINIPNILELPFFTTIPYNGLKITRKSFIDSLHAMYPSVSWEKAFQVGDNPFIIRDHNNNIRQIVPGEYILLSTPMDSIRCAGWGSTKPIPAQYVITTDEKQFIESATARYNAHIKQAAQLNNLPMVDMHAFMSSMFSGYAYNGIKYTATYITGGAYSLDGVHPTQRGYALLANHIITTVNSYYKSTVPLTDVNRFPGIVFP